MTTNNEKEFKLIVENILQNKEQIIDESLKHLEVKKKDEDILKIFNKKILEYIFSDSSQKFLFSEKITLIISYFVENKFNFANRVQINNVG